MSLNNLRLGPHLLKELYPNSLLQVDAASAVPETAEPATPSGPDIRYLGNHKKQIAVLINNESMAFLPDNELNFLTNVLTACKLSLADVAIININRVPPSMIHEKLEEMQSKNILMMGISPADMDLPIHFPAFQLQPFNNRTWLHAPTLKEMESDKGLKMQLWNALKTLFQI
jgi:DNA polymerase III psi subunit